MIFEYDIKNWKNRREIRMFDGMISFIWITVSFLNVILIVRMIWRLSHANQSKNAFIIFLYVDYIEMKYFWQFFF
jgi:hypothetical protein